MGFAGGAGRGGGRVQILAVAEGGAGELAATADGKRVAFAAAPCGEGRRPLSVSAEIAAARAGKLRITWTRGDRGAGVPRGRGRRARVARRRARAASKVVWASQRAWDRRCEDLYSAWIETLFDAPVDQSVDFRPLHQALRDPARNFLYGYLGLREDDPKNKAADRRRRPTAPTCRTSCAPTSPGSSGLPVRVPRLRSRHRVAAAALHDLLRNEDAPTGKEARGRAVKSFFRQMANRVQSGSARTGLDDDAHRLLPGARSTAGRCGRASSTPIPTAT